MKNSTLLLIGGGALLALSARKKSSQSDAKDAALASQSAINTAQAAGGSAAANEALKKQVDVLAELLTDHTVKGLRVGQVPSTPASAPLNYAPFSPQKPPNVNQFAIMMALIPDAAKASVSPQTLAAYSSVIKSEPKLLALVKEGSVMNRILNGLLLLSPQRQRMFAAKCAFMAAQFLDVGELKKTQAKAIALEAIANVRARAEGKITSSELVALNKPRISELKSINILAGKPAYVTSAIEALEYASMASPSNPDVGKKKVLHYLEMVSSVTLSKKSINEFHQKVAQVIKHSDPGQTIIMRPGMSAEQARAAQAKAGRHAEQAVEVEMLEKILRDL
jgi:hypothetical protein